MQRNSRERARQGRRRDQLSPDFLPNVVERSPRSCPLNSDGRSASFPHLLVVARHRPSSHPFAHQRRLRRASAPSTGICLPIADGHRHTSPPNSRGRSAKAASTGLAVPGVVSFGQRMWSNASLPVVKCRLTPRCSGRHPGDLSNNHASGVDHLSLRSAARPGGAAELIVR
jgi:hypothetical protein